MKDISILLGLDGTAQCHQAMELCFKLAKMDKVKLTAQHVVDSLGLWDFLNFDTPGLMGSGPYLMAHESIRRELLSLGETLTEVYSRYCLSSGIESDCVLDEGNTIREIHRRAQEHDLIVMGHRPTGVRSPAEERRRFPRRSVSEKLLHYVNRPVIVVQEAPLDWKSITLIVSSERPFLNSFAGCVELANLLALPLHLCFWIQSEQEECRIPHLIEVMSKSLSTPAEFDVRTVKAQTHWWLPSLDISSDTLFVIPSSENSRVTETVFGSPPDIVLRHLKLPTVMFWPEEFRFIQAGNLDNASNRAVV